MNHYLARFLTMVVVSALLATPLTVFATEVDTSAEVTLSATNASHLQDNDTLFAGYLQQLMYPEQSVSVYGTFAREGLTEIEKYLYDGLKTELCKIANGTRESTEIEVDISEFTTSFSVEELNPDLSGKTIIYNKNDEEAMGLITDLERIATEKTLDLNAALNATFQALLYDCPYEYYWFDKTTENSAFFSVNFHVMCKSDNVVDSIQLSSVIGKFSVVKVYQPSEYDEKNPRVDTSKTGAAASAVRYAKSIVKEKENLSDYEKLKAYRDTICDLVEYNHDAAESDYTGGYGDPWQIIYVFDQDPNTKVVCEGYAKAFQYLCDLSQFNEDIRCYIVTGIMRGATGGGGHMWNIVTMEDGKNYLADITNSDAGTVGQNGDLFLAGTTESVTGGYKFMSDTGNAVSFIYDEDSIWNSAVLTLAESKYQPPTTNKQYAKVTSGFRDSIVVEKLYHSQTKQLVLEIRSKGNTPLPQNLTGYLAVYQSRGLQSVTLISVDTEDSVITLTVDLSDLSDDAKYSVMIWTDTLAPLIQPINDITK